MPRDFSNALDKFAQNQQVQTGVSTEQAFAGLGGSFSRGYLLPEPKTGLIATVFPSDATWHPLFNHSYSEITENLVAIDSTNLDPSQKEDLQEKVGETVRQSYYVRARAGLIWAVVIALVICVIVWYTDSWETKTSPIEIGRAHV